MIDVVWWWWVFDDESSLCTDAILPPNHQFPAKSMPRGSAIGEEDINDN